jgi:hypothetical protein
LTGWGLQLRSISEIENSELRPELPGVTVSGLSILQVWTTGAAMRDQDFRSAIEEVVRKLPERLRADLNSRDAVVRQSAEEVVATKIALALEELRAA